MMSPLTRARLYFLKERLRKLWSRVFGMRLAYWLDKRFPEWCWADICTDIGLGEGLAHPLRARDSRVCVEDCKREGCCWCGKMRKPTV